VYRRDVFGGDLKGASQDVVLHVSPSVRGNPSRFSLPCFNLHLSLSLSLSLSPLKKKKTKAFSQSFSLSNTHKRDAEKRKRGACKKKDAIAFA
jgi:hypothetical protein